MPTFNRYLFWIGLSFVSVTVKIECKYTYGSLPEEVETHARNRGLFQDEFTEFDVAWLVRDKSSNSNRQKRSIRFTDDELISFVAFNDTFLLSLRKTESVLHPDAVVKVTNGDEVTSHPVSHRDCNWSGDLLSHDGMALFSTCHAAGVVVGSLTVKDHMYHVQSLPASLSRHYRTIGHVDRPYVIARKSVQPTQRHLDEKMFEFDTERPMRLRRQTTNEKPRNITVEVGLYVDADYTNELTARGMTTIDEKLDFIIQKWSGVQYNFNLPRLEYDVKIQLKMVNFFEINPSWYVRDSLIHKIALSVCKHQEDGPPFDVVFTQTGVSNPDVGGRAAQNGACNRKRRCGITRDLSWGAPYLLSHELGHLLGMKHTDQTPCAGNASEVGGIMGGGNPGWSPCSAESAHNFLQSDQADCLFEENVPIESAPGPVIAKFDGLLPGMFVSKDESCEKQFGEGFRFWTFPHLPPHCSAHVCLNFNIGPRYGEMKKRGANIHGTYCGDGKACHGQTCQTYEELHITAPVPTRPGGWSEFQPFLPASRSCGTGARVSARKCDKPTPLNSPECEGEEYQAELANTQACPEDVDDYYVIRIIRASEVCRKLLRNGVISSEAFGPNGVPYKTSGIGQCEVKCERIDGGYNYLQKWGLYDDGVPCDLGLERSDWPRAPGYKGHCIRGHCKAFGCDGKLNGQVYDRCGVCGGNESTCDVTSGVFYESGSLSTVVTLPTGAYNIEVSMSRQRTGSRRLYLELRTKEDAPLLGQSVNHYRKAEVRFAGTAWRWDNREFLLAKGPLNQPVNVKVFHGKGAVNEGIQYSFSTPSSNRDCQSNVSSCNNSGKWQNCGCQCLGKTGGTDCTIEGYVPCFNGETFNRATGRCDCNEREFAARCACRLPYKGENCRECKISTCRQYGVFNNNTCRCECPAGYGGLQCEKKCKDYYGGNYCEVRRGKGDCESKAALMEDLCPLSCGYCRTGQETLNITRPVTPIEQCTPSEFTCTDDSCIDIRLVGNGIHDCADGSDEALDPTRPTVTTTSSGSEINVTSVTTAPKKQCTGLEFPCADDSCIDVRLVGNGAKDCADGSDETPISASAGNECSQLTVLTTLIAYCLAMWLFSGGVGEATFTEHQRYRRRSVLFS